MNLPVINNKMKNHNNQFQSGNSPLSPDGFGLGIQVFKIQSVKNIDANLKSKNRTMMKNIQNPIQTATYKPPALPKPKRLPSLEKSSSQIKVKQRISGFINSKMNGTNIHADYHDKIVQKKVLNSQTNNIVTPVSYSVRKKVGISTQKHIIHQPNQSNKAIIIQKKQRQGISYNKAISGVKLNQTAPPQAMYKAPEQFPYFDYHSQHGVMIKFYSQFEEAQKQHIKQIKQLKKLKQNEQSQEIYDRIEYLQTKEGKIETVIDNIQKRQFDCKMKQIVKNQDKKMKRNINTIVPVTGFITTDYEIFECNSIQQYQIGDFSGSFKINSYENVDFAPSNYEAKIQQHYIG